MTQKQIDVDKIDLLNLQSLADVNPIFYVADYQRGYRWDYKQVNQLMNDIHQNPKGKTYCLQPIMLTKRDHSDHLLEVIDGQQRLTTLYILLKVLNNRLKSFAIPFSIEYATRLTCIDFLKNINRHSFVNVVDQIEESWTAIDKAEQNVDNYHIFSAFQIINLWLETKKIDENVFLEKVLQDIKLIWYPVVTTENMNAKKMFRNINSGKIRLTSSDLIKALFVLKYQGLQLPLSQRNQLKQEFSNQWNEIEKQLNEDNFWFFITNQNQVNYSTRIGLLFDLVTHSTKNSDSYSAYTKYAEGTVPLEWMKIVDVFRKIHEWSTDEKYYHRIGFLVNSDRMSFADIIEMYEKYRKESKSRFYRALEDEIKTFREFFVLENINYNSHRELCKHVLLLYNILIFEKDFPAQKFPFDKYVNEEWSLEHIHPQNPQDFSHIEDVKFWLIDTKKILDQKHNNLGEKLPVMDKIESFLEQITKENCSYNKELRENIREIKDLLEVEVATHKINNLALLDKATNSKLGNGLFKNKREIILKIEGANQENYVPYATVNCFVKKYTEKDSLQNEFWSEADATYYYQSIKEIIYGKQ
ncbi:DUF262 domain-containing protein [Sphingobacterium sp. DR205]|uniref:DUF262 domain-containing protein n=1 Tax=Sphingobacterium sp. DR205 TaxID=2713573 RepID=UPI0013E4E933|nr:DUF262 domain-containing protein [Sphingobacterium sp. DR205]QIH35512.1 DUF262 domain-containing protein [Sphingobacterium sp. DR205]